MINVYVNYPNTHITIHEDLSCNSVKQQRKDGQRHIEIKHSTLSDELLKFARKEYQFASEAEFNDMWLAVDLDDPKFEESVVDHILLLLAKHYKPFRGVIPDEHCT